jgi:hypothetical protein
MGRRHAKRLELVAAAVDAHVVVSEVPRGQTPAPCSQPNASCQLLRNAGGLSV